MEFFAERSDGLFVPIDLRPLRKKILGNENRSWIAPGLQCQLLGVRQQRCVLRGRFPKTAEAPSGSRRPHVVAREISFCSLHQQMPTRRRPTLRRFPMLRAAAFSVPFRHGGRSRIRFFGALHWEHGVSAGSSHGSLLASFRMLSTSSEHLPRHLIPTPSRDYLTAYVRIVIDNVSCTPFNFSIQPFGHPRVLERAISS